MEEGENGADSPSNLYATVSASSAVSEDNGLPPATVRAIKFIGAAIQFTGVLPLTCSYSIH